LSITEQRAVGFIPAWSLASLQKGKPLPGQESPTPAAMTSSWSIDIEH